MANKVASIWAQAGRPIRLELWYHADASWTDTTRIDVALQGNTGGQVALSSFTKTSPQAGGFSYTPTASGYYTFFIHAYNTSATDPTPIYWLKAHYTATRFFFSEIASALKTAAGLTKASAEQAQYAGGPVDIADAVRLLKAWSGVE